MNFWSPCALAGGWLRAVGSAAQMVTSGGVCAGQVMMALANHLQHVEAEKQKLRAQVRRLLPLYRFASWSQESDFLFSS